MAAGSGFSIGARRLAFLPVLLLAIAASAVAVSGWLDGDSSTPAGSQSGSANSASSAGTVYPVQRDGSADSSSATSSNQVSETGGSTSTSPGQFPSTPGDPYQGGSDPSAGPGSGPTARPTPWDPPTIVSMTTLIDDVGGRVDWSHANDLIAFSMLGPDIYYDVYTMRPDGSSQTCLTCGKPDVPQLNNGQPAWHPSGEWIIFQAQDPDLDLPPHLKLQEDYLTQGGAGVNNNLWVVNRSGTRFYQLTHIKEAQATLHPHFSYDGTKLLWSAIDDVDERGWKRGWMLKVADFSLSGGVPTLSNERSYRPRAQDDTFYESHGFTPDGRNVLFSASIGRDSEFDLDIWMLDLQTQALTQLTDTPSVWDEHSQVSPSGRRIVWVSSQGYSFTPSPQWRRTLETDFWIMDTDGSYRYRLTEMRTVPADSAWNADGTKLVASLGVGSRAGPAAGRIVVIQFDSPQ